VTPENVGELLGRPRVHSERAGQVSEVGVATGMSDTPAGGDIMFVEAAVRRLHRPTPPDAAGRDGMRSPSSNRRNPDGR